MEPKFISLPKNKDELRVKAGELEAKFGMKQAFACIDGTHIPIKCSENVPNLIYPRFLLHTKEKLQG